MVNYGYPEIVLIHLSTKRYLSQWRRKCFTSSNTPQGDTVWRGCLSKLKLSGGQTSEYANPKSGDWFSVIIINRNWTS